MKLVNMKYYTLVLLIPSLLTVVCVENVCNIISIYFNKLQALLNLHSSYWLPHLILYYAINKCDKVTY